MTADAWKKLRGLHQGFSRTGLCFQYLQPQLKQQIHRPAPQIFSNSRHSTTKSFASCTKARATALQAP